MKVTPMIFNGDMVRAMLREVEKPGSGKTQTRRILRIQPNGGWEFGTANEKGMVYGTITSPHPRRGKFGIFIRREIYPGSNKFEHSVIPCPYGQPGDLIYVRETFVGPLWTMDEEWPDDGYTPKYCRYKADGGGCPEYENVNGDVRSAWTPSIHMPRWASRITLEITDVRVERLQDISEEDAKAEGRDNSQSQAAQNIGWYEKPRRAFQRLWDSIYGTWDANPWVWVIEYKPMLVNLDEYIKQMEAHGNG